MRKNYLKNILIGSLVMIPVAAITIFQMRPEIAGLKASAKLQNPAAPSVISAPGFTVQERLTLLKGLRDKDPKSRQTYYQGTIARASNSCKALCGRQCTANNKGEQVKQLCEQACDVYYANLNSVSNRQAVQTFQSVCRK